MKEKQSPEKRPTINDIARESGYSKTAVSFAFNDPSRISAKTKDHILKTAKRLGYIPNPMARNFSLQRHHSIGFLLPQPVHYSLQNPYTFAVITGIGEECEARGYTLTIIPPLHKSLALAVRNAAVDGIITLGSQIDDEIFEVMETRRLPFVMIDGASERESSSVSIDEEGAAYLQMQSVLAHGHRKIAIIGLSSTTNLAQKPGSRSVSARRMEGYRRAFKEYQIAESAVPTYSCECTLAAGSEATARLLDTEQQLTCIVTMSDIVAIGALATLAERGLSVPQEVSVIGFDNIEQGQMSRPSLTTIDQPGIAKGRASATLLFSVIEDALTAYEHKEIPYSLVMRNSLTQAPDAD
ncbi:MAG TPA: LacI family DNA-binding transcriptional regulator [Sphaerochaeta sp.]|nr:LacI family DNA-binding transcriptional regulator [Sphaerochaeta sp.]